MLDWRCVTMAQLSRQTLRLAALWLNLLGMAACGGDDGGASTGPDDPDRPDRSTGRIRVATTTTGAGAHVDGYRVMLDGAQVRVIQSSGTVTFEEVRAGEHTVELHDIPAGCVVDENPQVTELAFDETVAVEFVIYCPDPSRVGSIRIVTLTSRPGEDSCGSTGQLCDPNGYVVTLNGQPQSLIGVNEVLTIHNIPAGIHELGLADVAPNCGLFSEPTLRITVEAGAIIERSFIVFCG